MSERESRNSARTARCRGPIERKSLPRAVCIVTLNDGETSTENSVEVVLVVLEVEVQMEMLEVEI